MEGAWDISLDTLETSLSMQNMNKWTLGGLNGIYAVLSRISVFYIISLPAPLTEFHKYWPGDGLGEGLSEMIRYYFCESQQSSSPLSIC